MTTASPTFPSTTTTKAVLTAFVEDFLVDVPAVHRDGEYLIKHDELVNHIRALDHGDLADISASAEDRVLGL